MSKKSYYIIILCILENLFLQSQTPNTSQYFLDLKSKLQNQRKVDFRGNIPTCSPDTVKYYTFTSPNDSILDRYSVYEVNLDENSIVIKDYFYIMDSNSYILLTFRTLKFNNQEEEIFSQYIGLDVNGMVIFGQKTEIFYNQNSGKVDSVRDIRRNELTGIWENYNKTEVLYNANQQIEQIIDSDWIVNQWELKTRETRIYGSNDKLAEKTTFDWNNQWNAIRNTTFTYDNNNILTQSIDVNLPDGVKLFKNEFTYDSLETRKGFSWNLDSMDWQFRWFVSIKRDDQNREIFVQYYSENGAYQDFGELNFTYGATNDNCLNDVEILTSTEGQNYQIRKEYYIYNNTTLVPNPSNPLNFTISPNPTADNFSLSSPIGALIKITNSQGQIVLQTVANEEVTFINMGNQPLGIYFVQVSTKDGFGVKKLVKN
jgi:Secretion system C-terminal sorting domain